VLAQRHACLTPGFLAAFFLVGSLAACKGNPPPQPPPPEVSVLRVEPQPVTVYDEYAAQTEAPDTIEIRAQVTGLLERKAFSDGAHVDKGALLYVIDPRPFESQLMQAKANLAQAQANLVNAEDTLARQKELLAAKYVSQQSYDNAVAGQLGAAAQVDAQRAAVRVAQLDVGYTRIRAPHDGYVTASLVKPGALITAQQTLLTTLYSSDPMWVLFAISESKLPDLQGRLAQPGDGSETPPFHIRLVDGSEYRFPGRLDFVDAAVDEKTGTLQMRISVPNPRRVLRPGLFVRVTVPAAQTPYAILVPQQAVQEQQGLKSVFVVDSSGKAQPRQIVAANRKDQNWIVDSGLQAGEQVVVEGIGKVRAGQPVRAVPIHSEAASTQEPSDRAPKAPGALTAPRQSPHGEG
jgi:membrane fusion protein, multidrug efflux system